MKFNGAVVLEGYYEIEQRDKNGVLKAFERIFNTITSAGKAGVALVMQGSHSPANVYKFLAIGSGSTAAGVGDTALGTEITSPSLKRIAATATRVTTNVTNDSSRLVHTYSSTATQAVNEVGVFNSATVSGSTLLSRKTITTKNLVSGDTLQVTHTIIVA